MHPDLIVVGGGVIGSAIAYHAALSQLSVCVIDQANPAESPSASWASAGGVRRQGRDRAEAELAIAAIARWATLENELEARVGYRRTGNLKVAESEAELVELKTFANDQRELGFTDVQLLDQQEVRHLVPGLAHSVIAGSYAADDGQADPVLTTNAFAAAAQRNGAIYMLGRHVHALTTRDGRVTGVHLDSTAMSAGAVVIAAGAGTPGLAATAGLRLPVRAQAKQMLRSTPGEPDALSPVLGGIGRLLSLKQLPDASYLIGGGWAADFDSTTNRCALLPDHVRANWSDATALIPAIGKLTRAAQWAGVESESIDGLPFLGGLAGWPGLIVACGFSGHGFALAPAIGQAIVYEVMHGRADVKTAALRLDRIADLSDGQVRHYLSAKTKQTSSAG